jgi:hypothetical protein
MNVICITYDGWKIGSFLLGNISNLIDIKYKNMEQIVFVQGEGLNNSRIIETKN